jgi:ABC-type sulfate transport system permease subunit
MFVYLTNHRGIGYFLMPLHAIIIVALKLNLFSGMAPFVTNLMKDDMVVALELCMLFSIIRKQICDVLNGFLSFLTKCEEKKVYNMLFLMLDPRFKSLKLVFSLIGQKQGIFMVEDYDR